MQTYQIEINEQQRELILRAMCAYDKSLLSKEPETGQYFDHELGEFTVLASMFEELPQEEQKDADGGSKMLHGLCV
jgi:hypothetical protein